jgi:signal transduction histidine kinase
VGEDKIKTRSPLDTGSVAGKLPQMPFQKRKQLERDIEHITEQMYRRNKELAETNKTLSLLQTIDALALESHASLKMVCEHITQAIAQATNYPFIGLFTRSSHSNDELTLYGWSGKELLGQDKALTFNRPLHLELSNPWFDDSERRHMVAIDHLTPDEIAHFLAISVADVNRVQSIMQLSSVYAIKLQVRRRLVGVLVVGFTNANAELTTAETLLLDRLSETIGVALDNKLLFEENQRVLRQLKDSNTKLRALDEAKDDFISMASHQLRTPLTSVKGYLSMIVEGDAGPITPEQRTMLNQAYFSSQRMVYIIADLLNVSRLRTGKFIIDPAPANLASIVSEEIDQLIEIAKGRSLKLIYNVPESFPELMIDEIKTRQIIMNFIDNALYYTPAEGTITVELINKTNTIEFRVTDTGIGVPKNERVHLFTKFYRAGNARQTRPDGTGLGLFMAKKVVIAQGGAIIFESKEGKGSTFGFILNKSKLAVPEAPAVK